MNFIKATQFTLSKLRDLEGQEKDFYEKLEGLYLGVLDSCILAQLSPYVSFDNKSRPLLISKSILLKIKLKHGDFCLHNLLINAHDWNFALLNVDRNEDRINLIKLVPGEDVFLVIGAIRDNGFFILTHFETHIINGNELKSLLGRGDVISKDACPGSLVLPPKAS